MPADVQVRQVQADVPELHATNGKMLRLIQDNPSYATLTSSHSCSSTAGREVSSVIVDIGHEHGHGRHWTDMVFDLPDRSK